MALDAGLGKPQVLSARVKATCLLDAGAADVDGHYPVHRSGQLTDDKSCSATDVQNVGAVDIRRHSAHHRQQYVARADIALRRDLVNTSFCDGVPFAGDLALPHVTDRPELRAPRAHASPSPMLVRVFRSGRWPRQKLGACRWKTP